jgi:fermentation-respiration switch protein FrsA (DUF1100 family)
VQETGNAVGFTQLINSNGPLDRSKRANILVRLGKCALIALAATFMGMFSAIYTEFCPCWNDELVNAMLLHPNVYNLSQYNQMRCVEGVMGKEVMFPSEGVGAGKRLNGWFFRVPSANKVVLYSHGNAGNLVCRQAKVAALLSAGQSVFIYDYEGFGRSEGKATPGAIVDDSLAAFDYLVSDRHYLPEQIVAYGESIGVGVTGELIRRRSPGSIILESGFTSIERVAKARLPFMSIYPSSLWFSPRLNVIDALKVSSKPLLIIHGKLDSVISFHQSEDLFKAATGPKKLILLPNAEHNLQNDDLEPYKAALREFFHTSY